MPGPPSHDDIMRGELVAFFHPIVVDTLNKFENAATMEEADAASKQIKQLQGWLAWLAAVATPHAGNV